MALTAGSAGGIPGLRLRAWALVSSAGVLQKGDGVASVLKGGAGVYTITMTGVAPATAPVLDCRSRSSFFGCSGSASVSISQTINTQNAAGVATDAAFYVAVYE